jgi:glycine/D-amino acid oxidase-like deaminating enzyme
MTESINIHLSYQDGHHNTYLPVSNPTLPYWRSELHWLDSFRSTRDLPSECDIAIVGAGLAGVSAAYHLSQEKVGQKAPSIVVLEARQVCSGATGRNGGHVKIKTTTILSEIAKRGLDAAEELSAYVKAQVYALKGVVEAENLDCEFELRRSYDVFLNDEDVEHLRSTWRKSVQRGDEWTRDREFLGEEFV